MYFKKHVTGNEEKDDNEGEEGMLKNSEKESNADADEDDDDEFSKLKN